MRVSILQKIGPFLALGYGLLVIYYYQTGLLAFLVNPFYNNIILVAGVILILISLGWIVNLKHYRYQECEEGSRFKDWSLVILLLVPLLLAPVFKPQLLSNASAISRGVTSDLALSSFDPTVFAKPTEQRSLIEWVRILNVDPEPDHYKDQTVSIQGKLIKDEKLPDNMFQVGRFVMTCCAADARVVALTVEFDPAEFKPKVDQWIEIKGHMSEAILNGQRQTIIKLESAKAIPTPQDAYEIFK